MTVELALIIVGYLVVTALALLGMAAFARRKRRRAWQAYYDDPRRDRTHPSRPRR